MKKGQKVKYQDKYYWIRAIIKRKEADFILIKQGNRHIEVKDTEVKFREVIECIGFFRMRLVF